MTFATDDDVVTGARQHSQRDLIGHRARREEQRRLLPQDRCDPFLQRVDAGILAELIVTDRRRRDCGPHLVGGPGHSI